MIAVQIVRDSSNPVAPPTEGFKYVDQGNYVVLPFHGNGITNVYSDGATSCIIAIAVGILKSGENGLALAHLDSDSCIDAFFEILRNSFNDGVQLFAQGANPPDNGTSKSNAAALNAAIKRVGPLVVDDGVKRLFLQEGPPKEANRGDFGIVLEGDRVTVTNQPYTLGLIDRDPACGAQSIYCIMRRYEKPVVQLRDAMLPFTLDEIVELAQIALAFRKDPEDPTTAFTNIINLPNEDILKGWSTTPDDEASCFSDQLKQASCFALSMAPLVSLCGHSLIKPKGNAKLKAAKALAAGHPK